LKYGAAVIRVAPQAKPGVTQIASRIITRLERDQRCVAQSGHDDPLRIHIVVSAHSGDVGIMHDARGEITVWREGHVGSARAPSDSPLGVVGVVRLALNDALAIAIRAIARDVQRQAARLRGQRHDARVDEDRFPQLVRRERSRRLLDDCTAGCAAPANVQALAAQRATKREFSFAPFHRPVRLPKLVCASAKPNGSPIRD